MRFLYHTLESPQIQSAQHTVSNLNIYTVAVGLLIVGGKVLDARAYAHRLHTTHIRGSHIGGNIRVRGHILVVTTAQGVAHVVYSRREQYIHAVVQHFFSNRFSHAIDEIRITRSGKQGSGREGGAHAVYTQTNRTVGKHNLRYTETRYSVTHSGSTADLTFHRGSVTLIVIPVPIGHWRTMDSSRCRFGHKVPVFARTYQQSHLLLTRHGGNNTLIAAAPQLRCATIQCLNREHETYHQYNCLPAHH